jgi:hypothetical protein
MFDPPRRSPVFCILHSSFFISSRPSARPPLQNRLPWPSGLWHQSGMAKSKKNAAAVALGGLGGLRGGKARAARMTAAERSAEMGQP